MKYGFIFTIIIVTVFWGLKAQQIGKSRLLLDADSLSIIKNNKLLSINASYIGDFAGNLRGGIQTGAVYLGCANIKIEIRTDDIGIWKGGEFFIKGASTHGSTPSSKLFGDFQVASNIEAGDHTYIQELWYKQTFNNVDVTIGLQDLNTQFVSSEYSSSFMNSSFGVPSLISNNVPVPIFPLTTLGITAAFKLNESLTARAALFDGMPEVFENNQYNLRWQINKHDGALIFTEFQFSTGEFLLPGNFKIGGYYHSHLEQVCRETGQEETIFSKNYGLYFISDQTVWHKNDNQNIGIFAQVAASPGYINKHNLYLGFGINYRGVFGNQHGNDFGIAIANARFNCSDLKNETVVEMFYKSNLTENFFIQPDIQYIINPEGSGIALENALAVFMRFGINF